MKKKNLLRSLLAFLGVIFLAVGWGGGTIYYHLILSPEAKMFSAIDKGDLPGLSSSLHRGANPNATDQRLSTPLIIACFKSNYAIAKTLLEHGANPNKPDDDNYTPLMYACQNSDLSMVKLLLSHGAQVAPVNSKGWTAKDIAAQYKKDDIVVCLTESGH